LRRELPAGTYQIVAVFNGQRHPLLGPSHAYAQFNVGPTTLDVRVDPSRANGSRRILAVARLTDAAGAPVANARITLLVNSAREGELFTDAGGMAVLPIQRDLPAGTYEIEGVFDGLPGFLASRGSAQFAVAATQLTVPAGAA